MNDVTGKYIIMGVSGCGKSTIGKKLSDFYKIPFIEGEDFHPSSNVDKMRSGISLTDEDRIPWLNKLRGEMKKHESCILACSALKSTYRKLLSQDINVTFIYLRGTAEVITERLNRRLGHFMSPKLLKSQFETLEVPIDAIQININREPDEILSAIIKKIDLE